jgi:hypothetical protein
MRVTSLKRNAIDPTVYSLHIDSKNDSRNGLHMRRALKAMPDVYGVIGDRHHAKTIAVTAGKDWDKPPADLVRYINEFIQAHAHQSLKCRSVGKWTGALYAEGTLPFLFEDIMAVRDHARVSSASHLPGNKLLVVFGRQMKLAAAVKVMTSLLEY